MTFLPLVPVVLAITAISLPKKKISAILHKRFNSPINYKFRQAIPLIILNPYLILDLPRKWLDFCAIQSLLAVVHHIIVPLSKKSKNTLATAIYHHCLILGNKLHISISLFLSKKSCWSLSLLRSCFLHKKYNFHAIVQLLQQLFDLKQNEETGQVTDI